MSMITYDIDVLIGQVNDGNAIAVKCHDTGIGLRVHFKQSVALSRWRSVKKAYYLPVGSSVILEITKADGKQVLQYGAPQGDAAYFECHEQSFTAVGQAKAEVSIYGGNGRKVTSATFYIDVVEEAVETNTGDSETCVDILAEQIKAVTAAAERMEDATVHPPIIGENGNWWLWDFEAEMYKDSGMTAGGEVKTVNGAAPDENGNVEVSGLPEGASANMQLVTDANGEKKWEDRLAYTIEPTMGVVIPEQTTVSRYNLLTANSGFIPGETYTVLYDGVQYECVAYHGTDFESYFIGDDTSSGLNGNGEPFLINYYYDSGEMFLRDWNNTYGLSLSVTGMMPSKVVPMNSEYIPQEILIGKPGTGDKAEVFNGMEPSQASGSSSHAEGTAYAGGTCAHAEGVSTAANGFATHSEGYCTRAESDYQHVEGRWNIEDTDSKYAHIVGNGSSGTVRSNAHTLDWNGLGWYAGGLKVGGTGQDDTEAKEVATVDMIPEEARLIPENTSTHQQLVTDGEGNAVWEERTHYDALIQWPVSNEVAYEAEKAESFVQLEMHDMNFADAYTDLTGNDLSFGNIPFVVIWDGKRYDCMSYDGGMYKLTVGDLTEEYPFKLNTHGGAWAKEVGTHTFQIFYEYHETVPLSDFYLPTTVPVIQSASVGQTIVVKAVDEDGKPTEWEGSPKWLIDAEDALAQNLTAGFTVQELQQAVNSGWIPNVMIRIPQSDIEHGTKYTCGSLKTLYLYEHDDGEVSFDLNFASPSGSNFEILVVYSTVAGLFNDT